MEMHNPVLGHKAQESFDKIQQSNVKQIATERFAVIDESYRPARHSRYPGYSNTSQTSQSTRRVLKQIVLEEFALIDKLCCPARHSRYPGYSNKSQASQSTKRSEENKNEPDLKQIAEGGFAATDKFYGVQARPSSYSGYSYESQTSQPTKRSEENKNEPDLRQIAEKGFAAIDKFYEIQEKPSSYPGYSHESQLTKQSGENTISESDLKKLAQYADMDICHGHVARRYSGGSNVSSSRSGSVAGSGNNSGNGKDKPKLTGDGNDGNGKGNPKTIVPSDDTVPTTWKERLVKKILAAKGQIGSVFKGSDFKIMFKFVCKQLLSGKLFAPLSSEWAQVLQELKSLEIHQHAKFPSQDYRQISSKQVPKDNGLSPTPVLINFRQEVLQLNINPCHILQAPILISKSLENDSQPSLGDVKTLSNSLACIACPNFSIVHL
ncbi:hypothetical protein L6164_001037 [Bauhinia variegata]|uniref:Uncharacterized protein n=1 Tax=Bauhinia variegata TaxID=167791 RepID=A0ACB9Q8K3_BAUVA|nr:hypothetical protein L6164_001037 [Bauhinia variegata]